jgi:hypothetical protein
MMQRKVQRSLPPGDRAVSESSKSRTLRGDRTSGGVATAGHSAGISLRLRGARRADAKLDDGRRMLGAGVILACRNVAPASKCRWRVGTGDTIRRSVWRSCEQQNGWLEGRRWLFSWMVRRCYRLHCTNHRRMWLTRPEQLGRKAGTGSGGGGQGSASAGTDALLITSAPSPTPTHSWWHVRGALPKPTHRPA